MTSSAGFNYKYVNSLFELLDNFQRTKAISEEEFPCIKVQCIDVVDLFKLVLEGRF